MCAEYEPHRWAIPRIPDAHLQCVHCGFHYRLAGITPEARAARIRDVQHTPYVSFFRLALDATSEALERNLREGLITG